MSLSTRRTVAPPRFIENELDARGWTSSDLVRRSGLHRQLIWKVLHDTRAHLGQMLDPETLEGIARGFGFRSIVCAPQRPGRYADTPTTALPW